MSCVLTKSSSIKTSGEDYLSNFKLVGECYILYDIRVQLYKIEVTSQDAHWVAVTTWLIHYYYTYTNL